MSVNRAAAFWSWFEDNEHSYRDVEVQRKEQLLDALLERLQSFCADLWFEVGGGPTGPRELVLTAEGRAEFFPALLELVRAAPEISGWQVVAFKQPQGFDFVTQYEDIVVAPEATWFFPLLSRENPSSLGLRLAFSHFESGKARQFRVAALDRELLQEMQAQLPELQTLFDQRFFESPRDERVSVGCARPGCPKRAIELSTSCKRTNLRM